ncbi:MAG: DegV family protein [Thermoleophilia bacterium]
MDPTRQLNADTTAIVVDSSSDVPAAVRPGSWRVIPIPVTFGDETFQDGVDLDAAGFYDRLERATRLPTTAQPSEVVVEEVLRDALEAHETAVVLPLSRRMSGTIEVVRTVAERVAPDRILVLESGSVTVALGLLALRLQAALERGITAGEATDLMARLSAAHRAVFTLDTLEFLQRGGRIGRAQAVAGSLLQVRPILQILDGEVAPHSRVRGAHRVLPAIAEFVAAQSDPAVPLHVAYAHTRRPEVLPELRARVEEVRPLAVTAVEGEVGPTVGAHAGPGAFVVAFVHDPPGPGGGARTP